MKACPKCGCEYQRFAFSITGNGTFTALACFAKACDYTGPWVGPITFPPNRQDGDRAARAWDTEITRQALPAALARRLPARKTLDYVRSADYVKPARDRENRRLM